MQITRMVLVALILLALVLATLHVAITLGTALSPENIEAYMDSLHGSK